MISVLLKWSFAFSLVGLQADELHSFVNRVNDLQFLTRILKFRRILLTKSEMKTMYKKFESDSLMCYTINRADIRRSCRWYTILASLPGVCVVISVCGVNFDCVFK